MEFLSRSMFKGGVLCIVTGLMALAPASAFADLTAGDVDDNLNFAEYLTYEGLPLGPGNFSTVPDLNLSDRVTLRILDGHGEPLPNAWVRITATDAPMDSIQDQDIDLQAGADGVVRFFPTFDGLGAFAAFAVEANAPGSQGEAAQTSLALADLDARREVSITVSSATAALPTALDIMLVIDTTGSMDDEIRYLADEFSNIMGSIAQGHDGLDIRYGLIVYRDTGDEYTNLSYGFTASIETMQSWLSPLDGGGGGDYPEALDRALKQAVDGEWRGGNTARLLFLVADAPPHQGGYLATILAAQGARNAGIRIFPLAASGVDATAEYLMRASAALTQGRFLFLTDDSGIGNGHAEPAAQCYVVTTLTNLFGRVIGGELSGERVEPAQADIIRTVGDYSEGKCEANGGVIRPYAAMTSRTPSPGGLEPAPSLPKAETPGAGTGVGTAATGSESSADVDRTTSGSAVLTPGWGYYGSPSSAPRTEDAPSVAPPVGGPPTLSVDSPSGGPQSIDSPADVATAQSPKTSTFEIAGAVAALGLAALLGAIAGQRDMAARKRLLEMWKRG